MSDPPNGGRLPDETSLRTWAALVKESVTTRFTKASFSGILSTSSVIDGFSTWMLAGAGATAALMISNLDRVASLLGQDKLKVSLLILALSAGLGFLEKILASYVNVFQAMDEKVTLLATPILEEHEREEDEIAESAEQSSEKVDASLDMNRVLEELSKACPWYAKRRVVGAFEAGLGDQLAGHRQAVKLWHHQGLIAGMQFLAALIFVVYVALSL